MAQLRWECIKTDNTNRNDIETWRAKVTGGGLVSTWALRTRANAAGPAVPGGSNWGGGLTFVPGTGHRWKVDVEKSKTTPTSGRG
ncbi:hypothetical protein WME95_26970 [Sorangium sp. So ce327]|jgi:hypothetical protein|uniref:hypothetical protein n=1 Tax=Sorangium sp. So ce327 TaxID=3133301 RepID=UPI003F5E4266